MSLIEKQEVLEKFNILGKNFTCIKRINFLSKVLFIFQSSVTGSLRGFVGNIVNKHTCVDEYWTGWYGQEDSAFKKVLHELSEYICNTHPIEFKIFGTVRPEINHKKSFYRDQLKTDFMQALIDCKHINEENFVINTSRMSWFFKINFKENTFTGNFLGTFPVVYQKYVLKEKFIQDGQIVTSACIEPKSKKIHNELLNFFKY